MRALFCFSFGRCRTDHLRHRRWLACGSPLSACSAALAIRDVGGGAWERHAFSVVVAAVRPIFSFDHRLHRVCMCWRLWWGSGFDSAPPPTTPYVLPPLSLTPAFVPSRSAGSERPGPSPSASVVGEGRGVRTVPYDQHLLFLWEEEMVVVLSVSPSAIVFVLGRRVGSVGVWYVDGR